MNKPGLSTGCFEHLKGLIITAMTASMLSWTVLGHNVSGNVSCTDTSPPTPLGGLCVNVSGSSGTFTGSTDANGNYFIEIEHADAILTVTICVVPPGLSIVSPASGQHTFQHFSDCGAGPCEHPNKDFQLTGCQPPPPGLGEVGDTVYCDTNGNHVQDAGEGGIPGVKVTIVCKDASGNVIDSASMLTDSNGHYLFSDVPPGHCEVSVDTSTVPQDCSVPVCDTTVSHDMAPGEVFLDADFCFKPPGACPECVDPQLGLGAAASSSVFQLGAAKVSITGPAGGIIGDISIAPNGKLSMSGDEFITGTVKLGPGATFSNSSGNPVNVQNNVDLTAQINAAYAAANNAANLPPTQVFAKLDGNGVTTIIGAPGINVIKVGDVSLSGKQITLSAPAGSKFILNVTGKFTLTGGGNGPKILVAGGIQPKDVLYNIIGIGSDVAFSGGGGGVNCCAAVVDGTLLAPYRKINLSPGLVNGEVISGKDISIVSGSSVRCPPCP